jgi:hypothetical protein
MSTIVITLLVSAKPSVEILPNMMGCVHFVYVPIIARPISICSRVHDARDQNLSWHRLAERHCNLNAHMSAPAEPTDL